MVAIKGYWVDGWAGHGKLSFACQNYYDNAFKAGLRETIRIFHNVRVPNDNGWAQGRHLTKIPATPSCQIFTSQAKRSFDPWRPRN